MSRSSAVRPGRSMVSTRSLSPTVTSAGAVKAAVPLRRGKSGGKGANTSVMLSTSPGGSGFCGGEEAATRRTSRGRGLRPQRSVVGHLVDADRRGDDEGVVCAGRDLDPVAVADPEPALGDLGDLVAVALDLVLVVDDVALGGQLPALAELDREALPQRRDERLLHRADRASVTLQLHGVPDAQLLLLDLEQLVARRRLEHEGAAQPQRLAVDLERVPVLLGVDPEVVSDGEEL